MKCFKFLAYYVLGSYYIFLFIYFHFREENFPPKSKMANIENLKAFDPFADASKGDDVGVQDGIVHVRYE
jgi:hypothetical protein